jgi:hypothetical protein
MNTRKLWAGALLAVAGAVALAGCGSDGRPAKTAAPARASAATHAAKHPREAIWMYRVLGDDPLPDMITVWRDGSVQVVRGGGHGGSEYNDVILPREEQRKVLRLARRTPLRLLAHNTITPGGFGGWDNTMRYMIRRDHKTVAVEQGDIPKPIRPLVRELDRIIEFDVGHIAHSELHSGVDQG